MRRLASLRLKRSSRSDSSSVSSSSEPSSDEGSPDVLLSAFEAHSLPAQSEATFWQQLGIQFTVGHKRPSIRPEKILAWRRETPCAQVENTALEVSGRTAANDAVSALSSPPRDLYLVRLRGMCPTLCCWLSEEELRTAGAQRQLARWRLEIDEELEKAPGSFESKLPELQHLLTVERIISISPRKGRRNALRRRRISSTHCVQGDATRGEPGTPALGVSCSRMLQAAQPHETVRLPRSSSSVLIKWAGLDYSQLSWVRWSIAQHLQGACKSWHRCYRLFVSPPLCAPSPQERSVEIRRPFHPQTEQELHVPSNKSLRGYQVCCNMPP